MSRLIWVANILLSSTVLITQYQLIKWGVHRKPSKLALRILNMVKQKKKITGIIIKVLAEAGKANMIPFPVTRSTICDSIAACTCSQLVGNALANKSGSQL
jgi:hypothetical protein